MAKPKLLTTPKGRAIYPHLTTPDTKFKEQGQYHVKLSIPSDQAADIVKAIDEKMAESLQAAKENKENKGKKVKPADPPYSVDEETGETIVSLKMNASFIGKDKQKVTMTLPIFDAKGKPTKVKRIGGGSVLRVSFVPEAFYTPLVGAGVTLRMKAVQLLELKEYSADAKTYGFGEEDGFSSEGESEFPEETPPGAAEEEETSTPAAKEAGDGSDF